MELYSHQILGWAMGKCMKVQLVLDALAMAYWHRKPAEGLLHHRDRGNQYACEKYQQKLQDYGVIPSMSHKGSCWDNAPAERFFDSLKSEHLADFRFNTRDMARRGILEHITFYNVYRSHSPLGYVSAMEFERQKRVKAV